MEFEIKELRDLKSYVVEWAEAGTYFLSRRDTLFWTDTLNPPPPTFTLIGRVAAPSWKRLASRSRLAQRFLRFMFSNAIPLANGDIFVTFDKSVGIFRDGEYRELNGLERPCRVLRSACAAASDGTLYFGEYLNNPDRGEMRVYSYTPGADDLETAYVFPAGTVRHIHGVYADPYSGDLFCLTGDEANECQILRTSDGFATTDVVGGGDETWRAVSMLFTEEAFYYGTDAEFRENEIYRVERSSGDRRSLGMVSGTVFYSRQLGDHLIFGTTAEAAPSQKHNVAAIYAVGPDDKLTELRRFEKDRWHKTLFQLGTIAFANGPVPVSQLFFSTVAVNPDALSWIARPR